MSKDHEVQSELISVSELKMTGRNARTHPASQIEKLQDSFKRYGVTKPVLVDENNVVIVGRGRVEAAIKAGEKSVPCVRVSGWTDHKKRAFAVAENRLGELSHWDAAILQASVGESEVLRKLFPDGQSDKSVKPKEPKSQPVGDVSRYLTVGRSAFEITEREEALLVASLRFYVTKFGMNNGFITWILAEGKNA